MVLEGFRLSSRKEILDRPPYHLSDQFFIGGGGDLSCGHALSISEHGKAVGNFAHLFEKMTDVNNAQAFTSQFSDECEKAFHVLALQATGGFIHENNPRARSDGPADFNNLPRRYR